MFLKRSAAQNLASPQTITPVKSRERASHQNPAISLDSNHQMGGGAKTCLCGLDSGNGCFQDEDEDESFENSPDESTPRSQEDKDEEGTKDEDEDEDGFQEDRDEDPM